MPELDLKKKSRSSAFGGRTLEKSSSKSNSGTRFLTGESPLTPCGVAIGVMRRSTPSRTFSKGSILLSIP